MTKRKKKRISEKMRRYNLSLQRPQENEERKGTGRKEERTAEKMEEMAWISRFY